MVPEQEEKEKKVRFSITMSPEVVKSIDQERVNIPRSTYIEYKLREAIGVPHYETVKFTGETMKKKEEKR